MAAARQFASKVDWPGAERHLERLVLLVSEIATNAVLHARTPFSISLGRAGNRLRVAVEDASEQLPVQKQYGRTDPTGRGLLLVDSLASRWGVDRKPNGKVVWFELEADMA